MNIKRLLILSGLCLGLFTSAQAMAQVQEDLFPEQYETYKGTNISDLQSRLAVPLDDVEKTVVWVSLILRERDTGLTSESHDQTKALFAWLVPQKRSDLIWSAFKKISNKYNTLMDLEGLETLHEVLTQYSSDLDPFLSFRMRYHLSVHYAKFKRHQDIYQMLEPTVDYMDTFVPSTTEETFILAGAFKNYGQVLLHRNRFAEAIDYFFKSERLYQNTPEIQDLIFQPHAGLSDGYLRIKDYEKAEFYARLSLQNFIDDGVNGRIVVISYLAEALLNQDKLVEALNVLSDGEKLLDSSRPEHQAYFYCVKIDIQLKLNAFDRAFDAAEQALRLAYELNDERLIFRALHKKGLALALTTDPEGGEELINEAIDKAEEQEELYPNEAYQSLVFLYEYNQQWEKALEAHKKMKEASDAANREINFAVVADLEAHKELQEKERQRERLEEQNRRDQLSQEARSRDEEARSRMIFLLSVIGLLLVIIVIGFVLFIRAQRSYSRNLTKISTVDTLTELKNRRFIKIFMEEESRRLDRSGEKALFMLADIDNLSEINETNTTEVGNQVILQVAKIIQSSLRSEDIVSRWGGGKFLIICRNPDDDFAANICQRILKSISSQKMGAAESPFNVTISLGLTNFYGASRGLDWKASTHIADSALREVKSKGGNSWKIKD